MREFIFSKKIKYCIFCSFLLLGAKARGEALLPEKVAGISANDLQAKQSVSVQTMAQNKKEIATYRWWSHFFIGGGVQTFLAISKLKDYTLPKPGWRGALGYTFLHDKKHSIPLYFEIGHSVVSGTNPLVRTFDIYPILISAGYEYSPVQIFSFGATIGLGAFVSHIQHFPTVVDMFTNNLKTTKATGGAFSLALQLGLNFAEKNVELRSSFSIDMILEKPQLIPLPSFQLAVRVYPEALYRYARHKAMPIVQIKEVRVVEKAEVPQEEEPIQLQTMFVYFLGNSALLDVNAVAQVRKAADILKEHKDLFILFEGSTAQFGSVMGRQKLEAERVGVVAKYLEDLGISKDRIMYTPQMREDEGLPEKEDYTQYRYVRMRFIRIKFNMNSGEKNVYEN